MGLVRMASSLASRQLLAAIALGATVLATGIAAVRFHTPPPPILSCDWVVDLGDQPFGAVSVGRVSVSNIGGSPLHLSGFATSCACAGVEVEHAGGAARVSEVDVAPGSSVALSVRVSARARVGTSQDVTVAFASNDPVRPIHVIKVVIPKVLGGVHAQPSAALFGEVPLGADASQTIRLYDNGIAGLRVVAVRTTVPKTLAVKLVPPDATGDAPPAPGAGRHIASVEITLRTDAPRTLRGAVEVALAGGETPDRIEVFGEVVGAVACVPDTLALPRMVSGQASYSGEVRVVPWSGRCCGVSVAACPEGVTATARPDPAKPNEYLIAVRAAAGVSAAGPIRLSVRDPGGSTAVAEIFVTVGGS